MSKTTFVSNSALILPDRLSQITQLGLVQIIRSLGSFGFAAENSSLVLVEEAGLLYWTDRIEVENDLLRIVYVMVGISWVNVSVSAFLC